MAVKEILFRSVSKLKDLGLSNSEIEARLVSIGIKREEVVSAIEELMKGATPEREFGLIPVDIGEIFKTEEELPKPELAAEKIPVEPVRPVAKIIPAVQKETIAVDTEKKLEARIIAAEKRVDKKLNELNKKMGLFLTEEKLSPKFFEIERRQKAVLSEIKNLIEIIKELIELSQEK